MPFLKLSDPEEEAHFEDKGGHGEDNTGTGRTSSLSDEDDNATKPGACHLTREDLPNIVHSVVCSLAYLIYGAGASSLGASLPAIASEYHRDSASVGVLFTSRGVGYVAGTCTAAYILNLPNLSLSKEFLTCLFLTGSGIIAFGIASIHQFVLLNLLFLCQGFFFGAIEATANCALPSMWGKRVQPWIQAMFACYGIGSMLGPIMVGAMNYHIAYVIIAISSMLPMSVLWYYDAMRQQGYSRQLDKYCLCCLTSTTSSSPRCSNTVNMFVPVETESYLHHTHHQHPGQDAAVPDEEATSSRIADEQHTGSTSLHDDLPVVAPLYLTAILACFMFFYVGIEVGFSGWITAYAMDERITTSAADAAYLSSVFWTAMTCGRMLAVVVAIYIRASIMIRVLLGCALFSTLLSVTIMTISYSVTAFVCALLGLAMSALFPLMITIMVDYGFKIDANTSSMLIVGGTLGQSILPAFIGYVIGFTSPFAMPMIVFLSCIMLCILYFTVNYLRLGVLPSKGLARHHRLDSSEHSSSHPLTSSASLEDLEEDDNEGDEQHSVVDECGLELVTIDFHESQP